MFRILWLICVMILLSAGCTPLQREGVSPSPATPGPSLPTPSSTTASLAQIQERGVLVVGTAITEPFEYYDPITKELVGVDVEITRQIAADLGVTISWVELPFASLLPSLQENKVDMVIAAMYITPEREMAVDFTEPYIDTGLVMAVRPELSGQVQTATDLADLKVGVKIGATGEKLADQLQAEGIPLHTQKYRTTLDSLLDLEVGRVDVIFNDYLNTLHYIKKNTSSLLIVSDNQGQVVFLSNASLGIAVQKGNHSLREVINTTLAEMKSNGTLSGLFQEYISPDIIE